MRVRPPLSEVNDLIICRVRLTLEMPTLVCTPTEPTATTS